MITALDDTLEDFSLYLRGEKRVSEGIPNLCVHHLDDVFNIDTCVIHELRTGAEKET
ncbi:MAG: hypothetical protein HXS44_14120 [Theionarchaea archaeon]|nr:hypothetical protein [Theionarchaea archaeon]